MSLYTDKQKQAVVKRALQAVAARQKGNTTFNIGGQTFDLEKGGYCNRFIRQSFETALGLKPFAWYFGDATARKTLDKLKPYVLPPKAKLQAGDIIGWYDGCGVYGHIALYLGDAYGDGRLLIAENTSAKRGDPKNPGTKITRLSNCRTGWKAYRLFPAEGE